VNDSVAEAPNAIEDDMQACKRIKSNREKMVKGKAPCLECMVEWIELQSYSWC
jgi:hypothetical protein